MQRTLLSQLSADSQGNLSTLFVWHYFILEDINVQLAEVTGDDGVKDKGQVNIESVFRAISLCNSSPLSNNTLDGQAKRSFHG